MLPILLTLLLPADVPSPPPDASTVRAVWLADLTPERVTSGTHGRFVFVPDSLVDEHGDCVVVEADGPPRVLRCVEFALGESEDGLDVLAPVVVEGMLVVRQHPAWGEFPAVEEVLVREARRVR